MEERRKKRSLWLSCVQLWMITFHCLVFNFDVSLWLSCVQLWMITFHCLVFNFEWSLWLSCLVFNFEWSLWLSCLVFNFEWSLWLSCLVFNFEWSLFIVLYSTLMCHSTSRVHKTLAMTTKCCIHELTDQQSGLTGSSLSCQLCLVSGKYATLYRVLYLARGYSLATKGRGIQRNDSVGGLYRGRGISGISPPPQHPPSDFISESWSGLVWNGWLMW